MTDTASKTDYIVATDAAPIAVDVVADIGNARTVVLVRRDGEDVPMALTMPSVRSLHGAFSWELFAARGLAPQSWGKLERDEHVIERDGVERFVGRLAVEHIAAASSGRGSDARYHDGTTLDFILAGIAAALPGASKITARLLEEQSLRTRRKQHSQDQELALQQTDTLSRRQPEEAAKATRRHKLEAKRKGETIRTNEKKTKKRRKKKTRKRRFQKRRTKTEKNLTM